MSRDRKRILIALDSSPGSLRGLAEAAEVAARLDAELVGLFVEDDNLLRLARLPQSSEIGLHSAKSRNLDPDSIRRLFKKMAERAQREVTQAAERAHVRSSFQVVRGSVMGQLLKALGGEEQAAQRPRKIAAGNRPPSIILMQGQVCVFPAGKAVIVLDDEYFGIDRMQTTLDLADESSTESLLFLVVSESLINARRQVSRVTKFLDSASRKAQVKIINSFETGHFLSMLENESCGTLIFNACPELTDREVLRELAEVIDYPIFLVGR